MAIVLSVVSNLLYFSEKIAICLASTALVCCIEITIILVVEFGIGLGYNYCYVNHQPSYRDMLYVPASSARSKWSAWGRRQKFEYKGFDHEMFRRPNYSLEVSSTFTTSEETESTIATESTNSATLPPNSPSTITTLEKEYGPPTMVIPINGLDLIALLSRLRAENRNYSLEIVTT